MFTQKADRKDGQMSIVQSILGSRALEALTSPHGVDRYLEHVNPLWAAKEVRPRIVELHREVDVDCHPAVDRKSVVLGKSGSVRVVLGGRRILTKNQKHLKKKHL